MPRAMPMFTAVPLRTISPYPRLSRTFGCGGQDLFVTRINAAGTARVWSTYLGGASDDAAARMAIDASANLYLTGSTTSSDFPSVLPAQVSFAGAQDAFLTKIGGCDISLTPGAATFTPLPANGSFTVNSLTCPWVAASNDSWITRHRYQQRLDLRGRNLLDSQNPGIARTHLGQRSSFYYHPGRPDDSCAIRYQLDSELRGRQFADLHGTIFNS